MNVDGNNIIIISHIRSTWDIAQVLCITLSSPLDVPGCAGQNFSCNLCITETFRDCTRAYSMISQWESGYHVSIILSALRYSNDNQQQIKHHNQNIYVSITYVYVCVNALLGGSSFVLSMGIPFSSKHKLNNNNTNLVYFWQIFISFLIPRKSKTIQDNTQFPAKIPFLANWFRYLIRYEGCRNGHVFIRHNKIYLFDIQDTYFMTIYEYV